MNEFVTRLVDSELSMLTMKASVDLGSRLSERVEPILKSYPNGVPESARQLALESVSISRLVSEFDETRDNAEYEMDELSVSAKFCSTELLSLADQLDLERDYCPFPSNTVLTILGSTAAGCAKIATLRSVSIRTQERLVQRAPMEDIAVSVAFAMEPIGVKALSDAIVGDMRALQRGYNRDLRSEGDPVMLELLGPLWPEGAPRWDGMWE